MKIWSGAMETKMEHTTRELSEPIIEDGSQGDPGYGAVSVNPDEDRRYSELLSRGGRWK